MFYTATRGSDLLTWNEQPHEKFAVARPVLSMKRSCRAHGRCMSRRCSGGGIPQHLYCIKERKREVLRHWYRPKRTKSTTPPSGPRAIYVGIRRMRCSSNCKSPSLFPDCTDEISSRCIILSVIRRLTFFACIVSSSFRIGRNAALSQSVIV